MHSPDFFFNTLGEVTYTGNVEYSQTELRQTMNSVYHISSSQSSSMYGGCQKCHHYSMVFGGDIYDKTHKKIKTEEDFEVVKSDFVEHFNKAHPDLVAKKRAAKPVKKKFEKLEERDQLNGIIEFRINSTSNISSNSFFEREYNSTFIAQSGEEPRALEINVSIHDVNRGGFRSRRTNRYEVQ